MTLQELLTQMHTYTPWELLHLNNIRNTGNMERYNASLEHPVTASEKASGLHFSQFPDTTAESYTADFFFAQEMNQNIMVVQHDRYTPPVTHNHDFYELLYVYEGEFNQQIGSSRFLMHTGDLCLIPPMVYHSLDVNNYSIVLNILIKKRTFQNIFLSQISGDNIISSFFLGAVHSDHVNNYVIFRTLDDLEIKNLILNMCLETVNKEAYYQQVINASLLLLMGLVIRRYEKTCILPKITNIKDSQNFGILTFIEQNYKTLTLNELADKFHYSPQHMSLRVKNLTGLTFTEYILQKKMAAAADYLTLSNMKIQEIGRSLGYQNQEHFIRSFRKYYNTTPSAFRSTHQKEENHSQD